MHHIMNLLVNITSVCILCLLALPVWAQEIDPTLLAVSTASTPAAPEKPAAPVPAMKYDEPEIETQRPQAAPVAAASPAPKTHSVWLWQEGKECLWTISKKYYGDPWQWKKIYLANKDRIADPAVIYPKQVLVIPPPDAPAADDNGN